MKIKNLKSLNEARQLRESEQEGTRLREFYAIGNTGPGGARGHLLFVEEVISSPTFEPGSVYACRPACNEQSTATIIADWDFKDLTCAKCLKVLERITKSRKGG